MSLLGTCRPCPCCLTARTQLACRPRPAPARRQFLANALDRARRMHGARAGQPPRGGAWRAVAPGELLRLEAALRAPGWWLRAGGTAAAAAGEPAPPEEWPQPAAAAAGAAGAAAAAAAAAAVPAEAKPARARAAAAGGAARLPPIAEGGTPPAAAPGAPPGGGDGDLDEDGLRVAWSSGPTPAQRAARRAWREVPLAGLVAWSQSSRDVEAHFLLPPGACARGSATRAGFAGAAWRAGGWRRVREA